MLIDPKTGQKILPNTDCGASHYHLMIDALLTGLHHANLQPDDFGEHEHQAVLFTFHGCSSWLLDKRLISI